MHIDAVTNFLNIVLHMKQTKLSWEQSMICAYSCISKPLLMQLWVFDLQI